MEQAECFVLPDQKKGSATWLGESSHWDGGLDAEHGQGQVLRLTKNELAMPSAGD